MNAIVPVAAAVALLLASPAHAADPHIRDLAYDAQTVVSVPVRQGTVTHVVLDEDERILDVAAGMGGDCSKADAVWCIAAQSGGRHLFVKPKAGASGANNVAVVTTRRSHAFRFVVAPDSSLARSVYRITVRSGASSASPGSVTPAELVQSRLSMAPEVRNTAYSVAEGAHSTDIVPTLVFDDGRFTYLGFPNNREVPAIFHVQADGSESLTNARMEGDLLVVDRVSRRLVLRAGEAVVAIHNEAFDLDGIAPRGGTTVPGVERVTTGQRPGPSTRGQ